MYNSFFIVSPNRKISRNLVFWPGTTVSHKPLVHQVDHRQHLHRFIEDVKIDQSLSIPATIPGVNKATCHALYVPTTELHVSVISMQPLFKILINVVCSLQKDPNIWINWLTSMEKCDVETIKWLTAFSCWWDQDNRQICLKLLEMLDDIDCRF